MKSITRNKVQKEYTKTKVAFKKASLNLDITITPLAGYSYKFIRFTTQNIVLFETYSMTGIYDTDYNVHSLDLGGKINVEVNDTFDVFIKPVVGIIFYDSAYTEASGIGTITGRGGSYQFNFDAGIDYPITENIILGIMFRTEMQRLEGGGIFWLGNSLDVYGGDISLTYKF